MVLGAAVIAGVVAAQFSDSGYGVTLGFGVAALVVGLAIVTAGTFRRRNGFLSFVALVLLSVTVTSAFLPNSRQLILSPNYGLPSGESGNYAQLAGSLSIYPFETDAEVSSPRIINIWQGSGDTLVTVPQDTTVRVVANIRSGMVFHGKYTEGSFEPQLADDYNQDGMADEGDDMNGDGLITAADGFTLDYASTQIEPVVSRDGAEDSWDVTFGDGAKPSIIVRIWQGAGSVTIEDEFRGTTY